MFYSFSVNVPASTPESGAIEETFKLDYGIVRQVSIIFPAGCASLVHCKIFHREHQVWPTSLDDDFNGDDIAINFNESYELTDAPYELKAVCWSDSTVYDHTLTFRFLILSDEMMTQMQQSAALLQRLRSALS